MYIYTFHLPFSCFPKLDNHLCICFLVFGFFFFNSPLWFLKYLLFFCALHLLEVGKYFLLINLFISLWNFYVLFKLICRSAQPYSVIYA